MSVSSHNRSSEGENINGQNNDSSNAGQQFRQKIIGTEAAFESPIDINISNSMPIQISPNLQWVNYEIPPKKMKLTNTGHTVILSAKWGQERPYITEGILAGKYVFSQVHLHWGANDMEGSEHTIDSSQLPGEMHVVTFKSCYLTQESALKERDGVAILVYMFKLQDEPNPGFDIIVNALSGIAKAHTSIKIVPTQLSFLIRQFDSDYFMYYGSVSTTDCVHHILWLITRIPIGVSSDQMDSLRYLLDNNDELIKSNFRPVQPMQDKHIFHVCPSTSKYSTLLPVPKENFLETGEKAVTQIYRIQLNFADYSSFSEPNKINCVTRESKKNKNTEKKKIYDNELANRVKTVMNTLNKYINVLL